MNRLRAAFEDLNERYPDPIEYHRARTVLAISGVLIVAATLFIITALLTRAFPREELIEMTFTSATAIGVFGLVIWLTHQGRLRVSSVMVYVIMVALGLWLIITNGVLSHPVIFLLLYPVLGSALFGTMGTLIGTGLTLFAFIAPIIGEWLNLLPRFSIDNPDLFGGGVTLLIVVGIGTLALWLFTGNLQNILAQSQRAARQLRTVAEIAEVANSTLDLDQLLPRLVDMIRDQMVFYHVQIFLIDDFKENAQLVASTGHIGEQLLARGHSLPVGSRSVIGQVTSRGEVVYATDASRDPVHRANEFLSATRSEIALPLYDGVQVIGALDVQSTRTNAFSTEDINTLEIMATQISIAVRNARLFNQVRSGLDENRQLYEQSQDALEEVNRLNRQLTGKAWQDFLTQSQREFGVNLEQGELQRQASWTPSLQEAVHQHRANTQANPDGNGVVISVPLDIRGQVLGAMEITLPHGSNLQDAQELVEAVASRLTTTLDNNRLFEEARSLAQQERVINEIGGRLQSTTDVNEMLQVALTELREVLGADHGAIRLRAAQDMMIASGEQEA
jgi:GAF domain-containing protein